MEECHLATTQEVSQRIVKLVNCFGPVLVEIMYSNFIHWVYDDSRCDDLRRFDRLLDVNHRGVVGESLLNIMSMLRNISEGAPVSLRIERGKSAKLRVLLGCAADAPDILTPLDANAPFRRSTEKQIGRCCCCWLLLTLFFRRLLSFEIPGGGSIFGGHARTAPRPQKKEKFENQQGRMRRSDRATKGKQPQRLGFQRQVDKLRKTIDDLEQELQDVDLRKERLLAEEYKIRSSTKNWETAWN